MKSGYCIYILILTLPVLAQTKKPELFQPGIINTGDYESHPAFSPNGNTLYFLKCTPDINNYCAICISQKKNNKWTEPMVAPFSGQYYDIDPFVTFDGKYVYFCSNRPIHTGDSVKPDTDIWRVSITSSGWGQPEHLGNINSASNEYYPTLSHHNTLYFGTTRSGRDSDIYFCKWVDGNFQPPVNIGDSINSEYNEYEPFISHDESYLIFMATVPNGLINADFYVSYNRKGIWSKAEKLSSLINSIFTEWSPKVTADQKNFFFSSTRIIPPDPQRASNQIELQLKLNTIGNGLGDIYFIDVNQLGLKH